MGIKLKALIASLGIAATMLNGSAYGASTDFDSLSVGYQTSFVSDGGLDFTLNSGLMYLWGPSSPNSNGTNNLILGFGSNDSVTITKTGGGNFDLNSFDMTISWYVTNVTDTVLVNGSPITLIQGMQTYNLGLLNVGSVTISGLASGTGYWALDNVNVAAIPEPETYAMLLAGLGLMGVVARRRQQALLA